MCGSKAERYQVVNGTVCSKSPCIITVDIITPIPATSKGRYRHINFYQHKHCTFQRKFTQEFTDFCLENKTKIFHAGFRFQITDIFLTFLPNKIKIIFYLCGHIQPLIMIVLSQKLHFFIYTCLAYYEGRSISTCVNNENIKMDQRNMLLKDQVRSITHYYYIWALFATKKFATRRLEAFQTWFCRCILNIKVFCQQVPLLLKF